MTQLLDLFLHIDVHLAQITAAYGPWIYLLLFLIIFAETGLVVTPFLPGDSLLFAVGALASLESGIEIKTIWVLLIVAAVIGDNLNYQVGHWLGPKVFSNEKSWFLNPQNLKRTQDFYDRHGSKTVMFARFLPIIRTFAPFVAGVGRMKRTQFMMYSFMGTLLWISCFLSAGYFFGNIPFIKKNFTLVVMAVIVVSLIPVAIETLKQVRQGLKTRRSN
jgi:membrane-associated protein